MANGKKVLVIEDDNMICTMYKTKLEQDGYSVFLADNGSKGLEMAMSEIPDIIMLDVIIPQLDGFSVLQKLKEDEKTKDIPVVMLTNLGTAEDQKKGKDMGAVDYMVKASFTPSQVSEKIKGYLK